jgi:hypothetical protein
MAPLAVSAACSNSQMAAVGSCRGRRAAALVCPAMQLWKTVTHQQPACAAGGCSYFVTPWFSELGGGPQLSRLLAAAAVRSPRGACRGSRAVRGALRRLYTTASSSMLTNKLHWRAPRCSCRMLLWSWVSFQLFFTNSWCCSIVTGGGGAFSCICCWQQIRCLQQQLDSCRGFLQGQKGCCTSVTPQQQQREAS